MNDNFRVWLDTKEHSVEGHIYNGTLTYKDKVIWGPHSCHDNTTELKNAIHKADPRFDMVLERKDKTTEGHTRSISVMSHGNVTLDKLSTHENMEGLVTALEAVLAIEGGP
jgi:hypothetical protein